MTTQGGNQIVVEIPGKSREDLVETVKRQAQLRFRLVACSDFSPCGSDAQTPQNPLTPGAEPTAELPVAPQSNNRPPVGFDRSADPTGEPTDKPKQDQTPSGDASPSEPAPSESAPVDDVPGVDDEGFTAPVDEELAWSQSPDPAEVAAFDKFACADDGTLQNADGTEATVAADAPVTIPAVDDPSKPLVACEPAENNPGTDNDRPAAKYLLSRSVINGTDLDSASAGVPQNEVSWVVNLEVGGDGQDSFTAISRALVGSERQFAIVLDGQVISAPTMDGLITNGQAQISGNFNETSANNLATSLKFGALPISFDDGSTQVQTIGPSLAGNQLAAGITAGLIGLALVMLYCLVYYRGLGLVVIASLLVAAGVTYAMVLLLGEAANFTLTLPGIAGLIVAVGITADSFIVYFERIRDEMRDGKSMRVAVESGWKRARNTCLAADTVSLLAAVVLFIFAVGVVKGFAFALGLSHTDRPGRLLLLHQAVGVGAGALQVLQPGSPAVRPGRRRPGRRVDQPRHRGREGLMGKFAVLGNELYSGKRSIDFVGRRWLWYGMSAVILLIAIGGWTIKGLNFGIEFTGGSQYTVTLPADQVNQDTADELREAVADTGIENASAPIVTTQGDEAIVVQTEPLSNAESDEVVTAIAETTGADPVDDLSRDEIGPSWGEEVAERSAIGLGVFLILVVLFIWAYFREWKMSVAALVALGARRGDHHRRLRALRVPGHARERHRPAHDPRLLALRHGRGVRQGAREHQGPARHALDVRPGGEPRGQPDPGPVDQHLDRGADPGGRDPVGELGAARCELAEGPVAGAVRRYGGRCLLVDLHRHPDRGAPEAERDRGAAGGAAREGAGEVARGRPLRAVPVFTEDMPAEEDADEADEVLEEDAPVSGSSPSRQPKPGAPGRGRTAPAARRPVQESRSSGRQQPSRQSKSKRQK